jgi:hypothetical protein
MKCGPRCRLVNPRTHDCNSTHDVLTFFRRFVSPVLCGILSIHMHDLSYFRDHLELFEQMARNRGVTLDIAGFRALDQERRESITAV